MPPYLALSLTVFLVFFLFRQESEKAKQFGPALWLPLVWMLILASRLPSQWLQPSGPAVSAFEAYQEGNALDRAVFLTLIGLSLVVLSSRGLSWGRLFHGNFALTIFLAYCLVSALWSDYPFIAFKRWFRDLGIYLTILVVLSGKEPEQAFRLLFRRFSYVVLTFSVTLIKYFPAIGRGYSEWTGVAYYLGVTTTKNILGSLCLVCGLFFLWDSLRLWKDRENHRKVLWVNGFMLAMVLWLLRMANSATSSICLLFGAILIVWLERTRPTLFKMSGVIVLSLLVFIPLQLGFDVTSWVIEASGREVTLTGRTEMWDDLVSLVRHPTIGVGYETFWLGDRLRILWARFPWRPNQAHNGYLEAFINLGLIGLTLLIGFLFATYVKLVRYLEVDYDVAAIGLTFLFCLLAYNITEASFKSHILWYAFLLPAILSGWRLSERESHLGMWRQQYGEIAARNTTDADWDDDLLPKARGRKHRS